MVNDEANLAALKNSLWHESQFRDDLILSNPMTIEDALHRSTRFIIIEEEKSALAKKYGSTRPNQNVQA